MVLGTALLVKCTATEETYPGAERVNTEHEVMSCLHLGSIAFNLLWCIPKKENEITSLKYLMTLFCKEFQIKLLTTVWNRILVSL